MCVYVCILSHPVKNNPIHLPSILGSLGLPTSDVLDVLVSKKLSAVQWGDLLVETSGSRMRMMRLFHLPKLTHKEFTSIEFYP